jgi:hypothetical protein
MVWVTYIIIQQDGNREEASERQFPAWLEMPAQRGPVLVPLLSKVGIAHAKRCAKKQRQSSFDEAKAPRCSQGRSRADATEVLKPKRTSLIGVGRSCEPATCEAAYDS